jgi:hypothetical protein
LFAVILNFAPRASTGAGGSEAVVGALHDEVVLDLRDRSEHVEEQPPVRCRGVGLVERAPRAWKTVVRRT